MSENTENKWFRFFDMYSGGYQKTKYALIFIEACCQSEAVSIFIRLFHRDPAHVTCPCCGPDFAYYETDSEEVEEYKHNHYKQPNDVRIWPKLTIV